MTDHLAALDVRQVHAWYTRLADMIARQTVPDGNRAASPVQGTGPEGKDAMELIRDDLDSADVARLLQQHLDSAAELSPPESVHALDLSALRRPDITFWSVRAGGELLGCGALKELDPGHGEIKSMRTAAGHLRRGVASTVLRRIVEEAKGRGYKRLSLETGAAAAFASARALYRRFGFECCGPFGDYREDPHSVFMTLAL